MSFSYNPLRRKPLKPKAKKAKRNAPWRAKKLRLDAKGMRELRNAVFLRSGMRCENTIDGRRCKENFGWFNFNLHHLTHRSLGGSDTPENTIAVCFTCHRAHHDGKRRIVPYVN